MLRWRRFKRFASGGKTSHRWAGPDRNSGWWASSIRAGCEVFGSRVALVVNAMYVLGPQPSTPLKISGVPRPGRTFPHDERGGDLAHVLERLPDLGQRWRAPARHRDVVESHNAEIRGILSPKRPTPAGR